MPTAPSSEKKGEAPRPRDRQPSRFVWAWLLLPLAALCVLGAYILGQQTSRPPAETQQTPQTTAPPTTTPPTGKVQITELPPPAASPNPATPAPTPKPAATPKPPAPSRVEPPVVLPKEVSPGLPDEPGDSETGEGNASEEPQPVPGGATEQPELTNNPALEYPSAAYEAGIEGTVRVKYTINEQGEVEDIRVVSTSGDDRLDRAAVEYTGKLRFRPATQDGRPVPATQERNVKFSMR